MAYRRHGAPFKAGDWVRILKGPRQGQSVQIYDVWDERASVRVDIGEKEKTDVTDVVGYLDIQKAERSEQIPACNDANRATHDG